MGTISSGVGLISGLNIQDLVSQLIEIEARPLRQLEQRVADAQTQRTAYLELNARLLGAKSAIQRLSQSSAFRSRTAVSSNEQVLSATAASNASINNYSFVVKSLATTHQLVSAGLADRDSTRIGAGTLTFEIGQGRVNRATELAALNGGAGLRRGIIRITDRSGASANVDLRAATDVAGVLDAINAQAGINVRARVQGDRIVITDNTGQTTGNLVISDVGNGLAAQDLGIAGIHAAGEVTGHQLMYLTETTGLSRLNDGTGVRVDGLAADLRFGLKSGDSFDVSLSGNLQFSTKLAELNEGRGVRGDGNGERRIRITNRNGDSEEIVLTGAETMQDVVDAIAAKSLSVAVALAGGKVIVTDTSGGTASNLKIEDIAGYAAADLGIVADTEEDAITGTEIYRVDTIGAVLRAIEYADGNESYLTAEISADGKGIVLTDTTSGGNQSTVEALNESLAARDLGLLGGFQGDQLESRDLIAGLNTVLLTSLNGGSGVATGTVEFTCCDNSTIQLDFSGAQTLQDVIDLISAEDNLSAEIDAGGTGIVIMDTTGGTGTLAVTDVSGATAADLHLTSASPGRLASSDLQLQGISENTLLADLNQGSGIDFEEIRITDSAGQSATLTLRETLHKSVGDVIDAINNLSIGVTASINDDGDGIKLEDTAGGTGTLTVAEAGSGSAAADLGILGTAEGTVLDGSFATTVDIDADDTLDDLVEKINSAGVGVTAGVINDGTALAPYRLVLTSATTGVAGTIAFSTQSTGLKLNTLTEASDATLVLGDPNSANAIVVTSSSNTVTDVVEGLTLNLVGTSDDPVQVNVSRDIESVVSDIKTFVTTYNDTLDRMDELTCYIPETEERGVLLGDSTVMRVQQRLYTGVTARVNAPDLTYTSAYDVGLSFGSGARLQFDEEKFRDTFTSDPEAVKDLFTLLVEDDDGNVSKVGVAARLDETLDRITNSVYGTFALQGNMLQERVDRFNDRAADIQELLDLKEQRLYAQFQAMERALASLQAQQGALSSLSSLVETFAGGGS